MWRGLLEYVDGLKPKPVGSLNSKAVKDFMKRSAEAHVEIVLHVETLQLTHIRDPDPIAIWKTLKTVHCTHGFAMLLMLHHKFLTLHKSDEKSIQAWVAEVRCVAFQMQEVSVDVSNEDIILSLTLGLPSSYESFIISLNTTPPDQFTLDYVIVRLMNKEAQQLHGHDTAADSSALSAGTGRPSSILPVFIVEKKELPMRLPQEQLWYRYLSNRLSQYYSRA